MIGLIRASTIALRRYFAAMLTYRSQAGWRRRLAATYLEVPLDYHRRTSTGQLLAHADADIMAATEVINPLPFSIGVVTLVVFAVISLATVDWMLMVVALLLFPVLALRQPGLHEPGRGPGRRGPAAGSARSAASPTRASTAPSW